MTYIICTITCVATWQKACISLDFTPHRYGGVHCTSILDGVRDNATKDWLKIQIYICCFIQLIATFPPFIEVDDSRIQQRQKLRHLLEGLTNNKIFI